jgi:hypothetical protein
LNLKSDEAPKKKLIRRTSEEEMAAAISASLREY